jgi:Zn-dependent protease with chaperone function
VGLSLRITIALTAVLVSAVLVWRRGRTPAALAADPAFPERRLSSVRAARLELAATAAVVIAAAWRHALWMVPLLLAARAAAALPLRRAIHGETWTVTAYLWFLARLGAGVYGFWFVLAAAPHLVMAIDAPVWIVGAAVGLVLLAWHDRYADVLRRLLRAEPLDDPRLAARVARMAAACGVANPRLDYVRLHGGVIANALALPSLRQPGILCTDTLLERFDHDEVAAICAHEVAHLEHFNPRYLRRWRIVDRCAILVGALALPVLQPDSGIVLLFPAAVFAMVAFRGRHAQRNETASDLRAVELTEDAAALVRALVKLNAIARFPRRWDSGLEAQATHPSLARRIQSIRKAAGAADDSLTEETTCASPDGRVTVVFAPDRVRIAHRGGSEHALSYGELSELRVAAARTGAPSLVAVDRSGRRWEVPLITTDVPGVQATLDRVDAQFAPRRETGPVNALPRAAAAVAVMTVIASGHLALLAAAVLALLRPVPRLLAAAGAAALTSAWLMLRDLDPIGDYDPAPPFAAIAGGCAAVLMVFAYTRRRAGGSRMDGMLVGCLGFGSAAAWCLVVLSGMHPVHLHDSIRQWPAAPMLSCAWAGALVLSRSSAARAMAAIAASLGLAGGFFGSRTFLAAFSGDPFVAHAPVAHVRTLSGPPAAEFELPSDAVDARLSPTAASVAASLEADDEQTIFHIGRAGGPLQAVPGDDVVFIGDTRALVLRHEAGAAHVAAIDIGDPGRTVWRHEVRHVAVSGLTADAASGRWRLLGIGPRNDVVGATGSFDGTSIEERRWQGDVQSPLVLEPVVASGGSVIVRVTQYEQRALDGTPLWRWSSIVTPVFRFESRFELWRSAAPAVIATSRLDVDCQSDAAGRTPGICWAFDGHGTSIFEIDGSGLRPIAAVEGDLLANHHRAPGWLAGWRRGRPAAVRLGGSEVIEVAAGDGFWVAQLIPLRDAIAAMMVNGEKVVVRVYDTSGGGLR